MLPIAVVRRQVLACYNVDRFTASQAAEKLATVADDIADVSVARIAGCIVSIWRHAKTGYDKQLQAIGQHRYGSARKDIQQATNEPLRAKLESLRIK